MNNKWFSDIIFYSPQDQVSFPTACEYANVNVKLYKFSKPYHRGRVRLRDWRRTAWKSHTETDHYIKHNHLISYIEGENTDGL